MLQRKFGGKLNRRPMSMQSRQRRRTDMTRYLAHSRTLSMPINDVSGATPAAIWVHILRLDVSPDEIHELFRVLSPAERQRAMRFRHLIDRRRFIAVRASLRQLVAAELDMDPREPAIEVGTYGKPRLTGECALSGLQFNVSHSGDVAVIVLTHDRQVGVDVEVVRSLPDMDALVEQNFSQREREEYAELPSDMHTVAFFNCWTRKEALIKAWGYGLSYPLDQFDVSLRPQEPARIHRLADVDGEHCGWEIHDFAPLPDTIAAIAVQSHSNTSPPQLEITGTRLSYPSPHEISM